MERSLNSFSHFTGNNLLSFSYSGSGERGQKLHWRVEVWFPSKLRHVYDSTLCRDIIVAITLNKAALEFPELDLISREEAELAAESNQLESTWRVSVPKQQNNS